MGRADIRRATRLLFIADTGTDGLYIFYDAGPGA